MKCTVNVIVYLRRSLTTPPQHNVNVNIIRMMMMGSIIIMCNNIIIEIITITSSFTFFWCHHILSLSFSKMVDDRKNFWVHGSIFCTLLITRQILLIGYYHYYYI